MKTTKDIRCEICGQDGFKTIQAKGAHKRREHPDWRNGMNKVEEKVPDNQLTEQKWVERYAKPSVQKSQRPKANPIGASDIPLNFCPCCGIDLEKIQKSLRT